LPDIEITLEANPSSVEAANFAALAQAGINRVSLGFRRWTTACAFSAAS
jgi:oxygen-independent coproporphyrinogen-3 oxidase